MNQFKNVPDIPALHALELSSHNLSGFQLQNFTYNSVTCRFFAIIYEIY